MDDTRALDSANQAFLERVQVPVTPLRIGAVGRCCLVPALDLAGIQVLAPGGYGRALYTTRCA